jgi:thioredoxin-like negative regulator of GroEL
VLNDLGEHAEAAATLREVLDVVTRVLGAEHPSTLQKANNLAVMLYCQGKHAEAAAMLREVLNVERRVLGPEHPKTMATAANLDNCTRAASENQTETETDTPAPTV